MMNRIHKCYDTIMKHFLGNICYKEANVICRSGNEITRSRCHFTLIKKVLSNIVLLCNKVICNNLFNFEILATLSEETSIAKEMKGTQKILDAFFPSGDGDRTNMSCSLKYR